MSNILKSKKIVILGLGNHGGGMSSTLFSFLKKAKSISILEQANPEKLQKMLAPLDSISYALQLSPYTEEFIKTQDIIIKNPAIPRYSTMVTASKQIETDISLYYQYKKTPTWMITGTKGKSSVSTALYNILSRSSNNQVAIAGNISYSPLNLILENKNPKLLILELSSFQLGDLALVQNPPFECMNMMILTNILPDHLNYYETVESYVADKIYPFTQLSTNACAILPYTNDTVTIQNPQATQLQLYSNTLSLHNEQCYFHSDVELTPEYKGAWIDKEGIWGREKPFKKKTLLLEKKYLPQNIPPQNIAIIATVCLSQNKFTLPHSIEVWDSIFQLTHRKEYIGKINNRKFYNDSAATIPQAMQLELFMPNQIRVIAGGSDKNLIPQDFISACKVAKKLYLLDGTYTQLILPLLEENSIEYNGPFSKLSDAVESVYAESNKNDIIILSPGCASFGMFLHEFDRGEQFKSLVQQLRDY